MSIVVMGVSHQSAPLDLLERCSVSEANLPKHLTDLTQRDSISEAVIVSTCNRTEVYVAAASTPTASTAAAAPTVSTAATPITDTLIAELRDHFVTTSFTSLDELDRHFYVNHTTATTAGHLFAVAAGIESAVIGESEILGQVKSAWEKARAEGSCSATLNQLFRHSIETAKRARTETGICRHTASVPYAAVAMATSHLGTLAGSRVLVVGAGEMAEAIVVALAAAGPAEVLIANRTDNRAAALARRVDGRAIALSELEDTLPHVDVLLTATGATEVIVDTAHIGTVLAKRAMAPLLIVDIAVPRDVDPSVSRIDGVTLLDMDDLTRFAAAGRAERQCEVAAVREIVAAEVDNYTRLSTARQSVPAITALRASVEAVAAAELNRTLAANPDWTQDQSAAVEAMSRSLVAKLLHKPTMALKDAAGSPAGDRLAAATRDLFGI